jgi:hypothetical protein
MFSKLTVQNLNSAFWKFGINIKIVPNTKCKKKSSNLLRNSGCVCACPIDAVGELVVRLLFPSYFRSCSALPLFNVCGKGP